MRALGSVILMAALLGAPIYAACNCDGGGEGGTARYCEGAPMDAGAAPTRAIEVGELGSDGSFVPFADGASARVIRGFQGSDMILPAVRVAREPGDAETACVYAVLSSPETGYVDSPLMVESDGEWWRSGTIELPIGGDEVNLSLDVVGDGFRGALGPLRIALRR